MVLVLSCMWFWRYIKYGPVAQLVRASPCHGEGRRFESDLGRLSGILAQLGEHLPYKQRVTGSSPVGPINLADVAHFMTSGSWNEPLVGKAADYKSAANTHHADVAHFMTSGLWNEQLVDRAADYKSVANTHHADVAQLAEQLICNQQVIGSSPIIGFMKEISYGWIPEWSKGTDCKSAANCFGGSNPPPSIRRKPEFNNYRGVEQSGSSSGS